MHALQFPHYLKILLVQLTNFYIEMGRMRLGTTFDEIINEALLVSLTLSVKHFYLNKCSAAFQHFKMQVLKLRVEEYIKLLRYYGSDVVLIFTAILSTFV